MNGLAAMVALLIAQPVTATVAPYCWIRSGEANSVFLDSSGNNRTFNFAFSTGNGGNPGIVLVPIAAGGPLGGATGPVSTISALWGSTNRAAAGMWQDPWTFPATNYVLEAWVLPVGTGGTAGNVNSQIASTGDGTGIGFRTTYNPDDDTIQLRLDAFSPGSTVTIGSPVLADRTRWTHVAAVNDNGTVTFYVNGVASGAPAAFALASAGSSFIGSGSGTFNPFHGYIDEVRYSTFQPGAFALGDLLTRPAGPSIVAQPATASVWNGGTAPFEVDVAYDESTTYQWKRGGSAISGATGPELLLPAVAPADSGAVLSVDVTSSGVTVPSAAATLTVVPNETDNNAFYRAAVQSESSLVAFFPVDGSSGATLTNVKNGALNGTLDAGVSYDGRTNRSYGQQALRFKGTGRVEVPNDAGFEFTTDAGTIEAIVYLQPTPSTGQATIFSLADSTSNSVYYEVRAGLDGSSLSYDDDILEVPLTWSVPVSLKGRFAHVAFVFSAGALTAYVDGESLGTKPNTGFGGSLGLPGNIGSTGVNGDGVVVNPWLGTIDELAIYSSALSPTAIAVHNSRFKFGTAVTPAEIASQPTGTKNLLAGGAPAFRVVTNGTPPLTYQWKRNGVDVTGNPTATTATLVLDHSTVAMSGDYTVAVTNPQGSDVSDPFTVNFTAPPDTYSGYVLTDNPSAYWRLAETSGAVLKDSAGGLDGVYATTVNLGVGGVPGMTPDTAVKFPGAGTPVGNAVVPFSPTLNTNGAFSIEFWVKPSQSGQTGRAVLASQNRNTGRAGYAVYQGLNGAFWEVHFGTGETVMTLAGGPPPEAGRWDYVVATWDGVNNGVLYVNGEQVDTVQGGPFRPNLAVPLEIGSRFNGGIPFDGTLDEVAFYQQALTQEQIHTHHSISWVPAAITQQPPTTVVGAETGTVTLTAAASGYPNTYQWLKDGEPLGADATRYPQGVTSPTLVIVGIGSADAGSYQLSVTNPLGDKTSNGVTLTFAPDLTPPRIDYVTADSSLHRVRIGFDRPVDPDTASLATNYTVTGLTATSVVITNDPSVLDVVFSGALSPGASYTLSIANVKDQRESQNVIAANSTAFRAPVFTPGVLALDYYLRVNGTAVANLVGDPQYPDGVFDSLALTSFSTSAASGLNTNFGPLADNYGVRIHGWITPPTTGNYTFFVRSDDASELRLSTDDTPANASLIAYEETYADAFKEPGAPEETETSDPIALVAGQRYYVEILNKEGGGGDYVQVAWRLQGDTTPATSLQPIPGTVLSSYAAARERKLNIAGPANGQVKLIWSGVGRLQESTDLQQWTDVAGNPASPYPTPTTGRKFYRLVDR